MDLYEALKSGSNTKELVDAFNKELEAATKRIEQEKENEKKLQQEYHKQEIADAREILAEAILDYAKVLFDDDSYDLFSDYSVESIEEILIGYEKEAERLNEVTKNLAELVKKTSEKDGKKPVGIEISHSVSDNDIIRHFLDELK